MEDLRDPSFNVPPALLEHVHLISSHRFPSSQQALPLEAIVDHLLSAPQIVRDRAAVSWQYIRPPGNGTIFLAWQPQSQLQNTFATDGYLWPETEQQLQQDSKGYVIDIFIADSGYIPGSEQVASHRRVRYRLSGSRTGQTVDSHLEIVHYLRSPNDKHVPVQSLPNNPQQHRLHKSRQYLENAGSLERKEFMLSDRTNWPKITMPGQRPPSMAAGFTGRPPVPGMPRGATTNPYPNPYPQMGNRQMPRRGTFGMPRGGAPGSRDELDTDLIDEEAPAAGDALDNIRPRDISMVRFAQHNDYMEEITSSPYALNQLRGADIILHCPGSELQALTEGLFGANEDGQFDLSEDSLKELEKRVSDFSKVKREEITAMKTRQEMKGLSSRNTRMYLDLEQKVRDTEEKLTSAQVDNMLKTSLIKRLEEDNRDLKDQNRSVDEAMQDFVRKEADLMEKKRKALSQELDNVRSAELVRKGGLLDKEQIAAMQQVSSEGNDNNQSVEFNEFTNMDSAGEALDFYSGDMGAFDGDDGMDFMADDAGAEYS